MAALIRNQKSATELTFSKKRTMSNLRNDPRRDGGLQEDFSPYNDI